MGRGVWVDWRSLHNFAAPLPCGPGMCSKGAPGALPAKQQTPPSTPPSTPDRQQSAPLLHPCAPRPLAGDRLCSAHPRSRALPSPPPPLRCVMQRPMQCLLGRGGRTARRTAPGQQFKRSREQTAARDARHRRLIAPNSSTLVLVMRAGHSKPRNGGVPGACLCCPTCAAQAPASGAPDRRQQGEWCAGWVQARGSGRGRDQELEIGRRQSLTARPPPPRPPPPQWCQQRRTCCPAPPSPA